MTAASNGRQDLTDHDRLIRVDTNLDNLIALVAAQGRANDRQDKRLGAHERLLEKIAERLELTLSPDEARRQREEWKAADEKKSTQGHIRNERIIGRPLVWLSGVGILFSTIVTVVTVLHL